MIDFYYLFLEVSFNGIISCDCCRKVVLEIKCFYIYWNIFVEEVVKIDRDFCLDEMFFVLVWMNSFLVC